MEQLEVYRRILRDTVRPEVPDADVLFRMVVLHTHSLVLRPDVVVDDVRPGDDGRVRLAPLTRTHIAELVAECFPAGSAQAAVGYWFAAYGRDTPYELFGEVPGEERGPALAARLDIARHPLVAELIAE
jgi:hypothetical protein